MVDLCSFLVGAPPQTVFARGLGRDPESEDSTVLVLGFGDGSTATIAYLANASPDLSKERFEVSADGRTAACDNFRETRLPGGKKLKTLNQDKGQTEAVRCVIEAVGTGAPSPFALEDLLAVSRATLRAAESARIARAGPDDASSRSKVELSACRMTPRGGSGQGPPRQPGPAGVATFPIDRPLHR